MSAPNPRKRHSFNDSPLPRKSSRMSLRRTESFLSLSDYSDSDDEDSFLHLSPLPYVAPRPCAVSYLKAHCDQYRLAGRSRPKFIIGSPPRGSAPLQQLLPKKRATPRPQTLFLLAQSANPPSIVRKTSPLTPVRRVLPPRASFPRSQPEPDLYRVAIKTSMANSPEGEKILRMGPRLAVAILTATRELERIVSAAHDDDDDVVVMADDLTPPIGQYWVPVHCGA